MKKIVATLRNMRKHQKKLAKKYGATPSNPKFIGDLPSEEMAELWDSFWFHMDDPKTQEEVIHRIGGMFTDTMSRGNEANMYKTTISLRSKMGVMVEAPEFSHPNVSGRMLVCLRPIKLFIEHAEVMHKAFMYDRFRVYEPEGDDPRHYILLDEGVKIRPNRLEDIQRAWFSEYMYGWSKLIQRAWVEEFEVTDPNRVLPEKYRTFTEEEMQAWRDEFYPNTGDDEHDAKKGKRGTGIIVRELSTELGEDDTDSGAV